MDAETGRARRFVTAADVAARAGVSRSAVSRTFTQGAYVSPKVRKAVEKAADEMGYRVNRLAKTLLTDSSSLVAIVGANLNEPFNAALLDALSASLIERGLHSLLLNAGARGDMAGMMNLVLEYRVRAVIILSGAPPVELIEQCRRADQRMILVNREIDHENADVIETDDEAGGRLAAKHLVERRYSRLGVVRMADTLSQGRREAGFVKQAEAFGLPVSRFSCNAQGYEAGCLAARELLGNDAVDAVFCVTDRAALGFLNTARFELGRDVPGEIGVVGFDDILEASWPSHALTTIRQPVAAYVDAVTEILDMPDEAEGGRRPRHSCLMPVELVVRRTTRT